MVSQSEHTEPARPHTMDELMHPGRHHHASNPDDVPCPDPSVHKNSKLQETASTAALYATSPDRKREPILDKDNKLSSRSAATSLKYAKPQDLPAFPVVGINTANSANSAANLANDNQKSFEHWKPDPSASASKAAMLAKDYKMAPLWKPEMSAAGSKAALLAANHGGKVDLWMPQATAEGNSAASQAMRNKGLSPKIDFGYTEDGKKRALMAATGAIGRSRSGSTPTPAHPAYPDAANSAHNALNAATVAHRPSTKAPRKDDNRMSSEAMEAARVQHYGANTSRDMFGSAPPVKMEVDERNHNAALRASAVSMAKSMYDIQQKQSAQNEPDEMGGTAARAVHGRTGSVSSPAPDLKQQAMQYIHLQEAAQKLANERLAKLDPDGAARYRAHYGYPTVASQSRLSMRGRGRRRAGSESQKDEDSDEDDFRSRQIRNQMSKMNQDLAAVDDQKRKSDRANLLAAAEKKVHAQMHNMDEKVFAETGKVSAAMMEDWETKARAKAVADSATRQENFGKTHIGGGRYMDSSEIEAIAAARLKPTLDEISDTAEKKRAHDEEVRRAMEEKKRQEQTEKMKQDEIKRYEKKTRDEDKIEAKTRKLQEKNTARIEKEAEKTRLADEKRTRKMSKSRPAQGEIAVAAGTGAAAGVAVAAETHEEPKTPEMSDSPNLDRIESPTIKDPARSSALHPALERHVTDIGDSDGDDDDELYAAPAEDTEGAEEIADRVAAAPITHESEAAETTVITGSEPSTAKAVEPTTTASAAAIPTVAADKPSTEEPATPARASLPKFQREQKKDSPGRLSGFFSKLKGRSKSNAANSPKPTKAELLASDQPTTSATVANPAEVSKELSANEATIASSTGVEAAAAGSPSSFRRHEEDLHSISSLSSDEGDVVRGREGRPTDGANDGIVKEPHTGLPMNVGKFGTTGAGGTDANPTVRGAHAHNDDDDDDGDGNEEFEEARDTFDETLAPPPSFGGQAKSASPVRETKFVEEL